MDHDRPKYSCDVCHAEFFLENEVDAVERAYHAPLSPRPRHEWFMEHQTQIRTDYARDPKAAQQKWNLTISMLITKHIMKYDDAKALLDSLLPASPAVPGEPFDGVEHTLIADSSIPPKPNGVGLTRGRWMEELHSYYETNKAAILADCERIGRPSAEKRWHIGPVTMKNLIERWTTSTTASPPAPPAPPDPAEPPPGQQVTDTAPEGQADITTDSLWLDAIDAMLSDARARKESLDCQVERCNKIITALQFLAHEARELGL